MMFSRAVLKSANICNVCILHCRIDTDVQMHKAVHKRQWKHYLQKYSTVIFQVNM